MSRADIKLIVRYIVLGFIAYMGWYIIQPEYAVAIKDVGEIAIAAIYGSVFGGLTLALQKHFDTKIEK